MTNNYRDMGAVWLSDHAHEVALNLSDGNPVAAVAITTLLSSIEGARAYKHMKMDLSPDEWDTLYHLCDEYLAKLYSNVIAINEIYARWNNGGVIHKNLGFASPALFTEKICFTDPERDIKNGTQRYLFRQRIVDDFLLRYSHAKIRQSQLR
jgi:hypothetical protein